MPTGSFHPYYPVQDNPGKILAFDESYFLIRLHDAQAVFSANLLQQAGVLIVRSSIKSSFQQDSPTESLHKFTSLKKNTPFNLGVHTNLTQWLPSIESDFVQIQFECEVLHGTPIKSLVDKTNDLQLVSVVSLVRPDIATALTIAQIVGELLSFFGKEGSKTSVFSFTIDLNLTDLRSGYYAVLGSQTNKSVPSKLEMKNGQLSFINGSPLTDYSYAVIEVRTIPRLSSETLRRRSWGELLYECRDIALNTPIENDSDRHEALKRWRISLEHVRFLARKDSSVLSHEVTEVIGKAMLEVDMKLNLLNKNQAYTQETYSEKWQQVSGFTTPQELRQAVRDYQDAVELSEQLLREYQQKDTAL